ncbi:hypothetical protein L798_06396 [Zootermopsis nevadensis]|uniref:Uncharacterized protein n=1 Tax=Zootermopsis nevadensis TaxID=136037 RepID=A0A067RFR9_ZOONE|nr:hypothetical protein L798_06396 [Zootermopsis nevadensis]
MVLATSSRQEDFTVGRKVDNPTTAAFTRSSNLRHGISQTPDSYKLPSGYSGRERTGTRDVRFPNCGPCTTNEHPTSVGLGNEVQNWGCRQTSRCFLWKTSRKRSLGSYKRTVKQAITMQITRQRELDRWYQQRK